MKKQEEIRKGIDDLLKDAFRCFKRGEWIDTATVTRKIQEFEASQGVVIEVEGELPYECVCGGYDFKPFKNKYNDEMVHCCECDAYNRGLSDGYVAVEPLIEEE